MAPWSMHRGAMEMGSPKAEEGVKIDFFKLKNVNQIIKKTEGSPTNITKTLSTQPKKNSGVA